MALSNENGSNSMVMPVVPYGNNSGSSWANCCETIAVRNTSNQPILVQNANIVITR